MEVPAGMVGSEQRAWMMAWLRRIRVLSMEFQRFEVRGTHLVV